MSELRLDGCTPEPLMGYLKALGVFRLVAEAERRGDPPTRLSWKGGVAHLTSRFDRDELTAFFRDEYRPTPILAPWNGGSGFYKSPEHLNAITASTTDRLSLYRQTIEAVRRLVPVGTKDAPKDAEKKDLLTQCRATLPDEVVPWLDACFVLGENFDKPGETKPSFFPLLGTGGNDGRLDFTNNFFQRLANVVPFADGAVPTTESASWLADALFADTVVALRDTAVGQFNPGGIGGANGVQGGFEAGSRVNPWDFVLMIEGALLFAGSVARRLGANTTGRAVFPFSVESVAVGYGSATASEETTDGSRAELWLPLWDSGATLPEVRQLFAEGRAQLGRRQAKNAVEFALAVNLLGVSRGVTAFARYGFLKRNGLAFLAAPLGRVPVVARPTARLLSDPAVLDWVGRLRRVCSDKDDKTARYDVALRQINRAVFAYSTRSQSDPASEAGALQNVLRALGRAERTLATRGLGSLKDKQTGGWKIAPLAGLSSQWLDQANDGSPEFRLAVALAGISATKGGEVGPLRAFLEEVEFDRGYVNWSPGSTSAVWANRSVAFSLAAVFRRRQLEAFRGGLPGVPLRSPRAARLDDVLAFLRHETDDEKLGDLLWALIAVDWPKVERSKSERSHDRVPMEFGIPRLVVSGARYVPESDRIRGGLHWVTATDGGAANAVADPDVFHDLAAGNVAGAVTRAARRLRSGGLNVLGYRNRRNAGRKVAVSALFDPERLLASMLFPLSKGGLIRVANAVLYPPEPQE